MTSTTNLPDGLYCLWYEEDAEAVRIDAGSIIDTTIRDVAAVGKFVRTTLAECETMDDMPTVSTDLAAVICEHCDLSPELVAVCLIPATGGES